MVRQHKIAKQFHIIVLMTILAQSAAQRVSTGFYCKNGTTINPGNFCDGKNDCEHGSDEIMSSMLPVQFINCTVSPLNNTCLLHRDYFCNGTVTCQGVTPCDVGCTSHYKCQNSSKCVPRSTLCDGNSCNGCPEDDEWETGVGFRCVRNGKYCRLPQQLLWDNVKDCDDGVDLCYRTASSVIDGRDIRGRNATFDAYKCFQCMDGSLIIPRLRVCNRAIDCSDLSDECLCEKRPFICSKVKRRTVDPEKLAAQQSPACKLGEVACNVKKSCIQRSQICDGKVDCFNRRDERYRYCKGTMPCRWGREQETGEKCRCPRPCIRETGIICDGIADCSVPIARRAKWNFPPGYPADECRAKCSPSSVFNCTNSSHTVMRKSDRNVTCKAYGTTTYPNGSRRVRSFILSGKKRCDGVLTCDVNLADERRCPDRFLCPSQNDKLMSIPAIKVCDGFVDCDNGADETKARCPRRFFCSALRGTRVSIKRKRVCDFVINCDNAEDEKNCTIIDGRFYCEGGRPMFVRKKKMFNGVGDCLDWSDECPKEVVPGSENILSSRYQLIGNPILRSVVWIMGILAFVGNVVVIQGEFRTVRQFLRENKAASLIVNHMLVLNLAVADFLMAIYLLMLGIAGAVYSGSYCSQSLSWLTSQSCVAMGVLVVLSSETSTLTMILLTCARLYAVFKPIESTTKPKPRFVLILVALMWATSVVLATIPLSYIFEETFVQKALLQDSLFFNSVAVHIDSARSFVDRLLTYSPQFANLSLSDARSLVSATTWHELEDRMSALSVGSKFVKCVKFFGYYSKNSVCIPNLFVTHANRAWKFSLSISIFNFLAFMFVASAYVVILRHASNSAKLRSRSGSGNSKIQRKIIRLIITDFCCWIPLSIMVFVNFSGVKIDSVSYAVAAIVLLPINSALNPILYSSFLDRMWEKARKRWQKSKAPSESTGARWMELSRK